MAAILIGTLILVLEGICWLFGAGLADAELPRSFTQLWDAALFSIPMTGFGSIWLISTRNRHQSSNSILGTAALIFGLILCGFWGYQVLTFKSFTTDPGRMISSLAFLPACLLFNAGVRLRVLHRITDPSLE